MSPVKVEPISDRSNGAEIALDHRLPLKLGIEMDHWLPGAALGHADKCLPMLGIWMCELEDPDGEWVRLVHQAEARYLPVPDPCVFLG